MKIQSKVHLKSIVENCLLATGRTGIPELLEHMEEIGFYDAPCSSKFHLSTPGGLAEHSINVCETAMNIAEALYFDDGTDIEMKDSIIICSLLHDLGKAGQFDKPNYIQNEDQEKGPFTTNKDLLFVPHEVRSIAIISKFIPLTEEEQFAILYHNGLYGELKGCKGNETPLYMILHFADMWASRVIEREK